MGQDESTTKGVCDLVPVEITMRGAVFAFNIHATTSVETNEFNLDIGLPTINLKIVKFPRVKFHFRHSDNISIMSYIASADGKRVYESIEKMTKVFDSWRSFIDRFGENFQLVIRVSTTRKSIDTPADIPLAEFVRNPLFADCALITAIGTVDAHRIILCAHSDVLAKHWRGDGSEWENVSSDMPSFSSVVYESVAESSDGSSLKVLIEDAPKTPIESKGDQKSETGKKNTYDLTDVEPLIVDHYLRIVYGAETTNTLQKVEDMLKVLELGDRLATDVVVQKMLTMLGRAVNRETLPTLIKWSREYVPKSDPTAALVVRKIQSIITTYIGVHPEECLNLIK